MNPNGCYTRTGEYFNEYPVYSNGTLKLFRAIKGEAMLWALAEEPTDIEEDWYYYSDEWVLYPTNDGNPWHAGTGQDPGGFFEVTCTSSSSSSSSSSGE